MKPSEDFSKYSQQISYYCNRTSTDPIKDGLTCADYFTKHSEKPKNLNTHINAENILEGEKLEQNCPTGCDFTIGSYDSTATFIQADEMIKLDAYLAKLQNFIENPRLITFDNTGEPNLMQPAG